MEMAYNCTFLLKWSTFEYFEFRMANICCKSCAGNAQHYKCDYKADPHMFIGIKMSFIYINIGYTNDSVEESVYLWVEIARNEEHILRLFRHERC